MRKFLRGCVALCLLLGSGWIQAADGPKTIGDGVYVQILSTHQNFSRLVYVVDSISQQCFAALLTREHFVAIPCGNLARRGEWRSIITWTESK